MFKKELFPRDQMSCGVSCDNEAFTCAVFVYFLVNMQDDQSLNKYLNRVLFMSKIIPGDHNLSFNLNPCKIKALGHKYLNVCKSASEAIIFCFVKNITHKKNQFTDR